MTRKEVASLYATLGKTPPPDIAAPDISKMRNIRKTIDGIEFDSSLEAEAYRLLKIWERTGAITRLELQPVFQLQARFTDGKKVHRAIKYIADFRFTDRDGTERVIDTKGRKTPMFRVKFKIFRKLFPGVIFEEWTRSTLKGL